MTQVDRLYDFLKTHGSATAWDIIELGILNYKGRIYDLRSLGVKITTRMEDHKNKYGEVEKHARYFLEGT